MNEEIQTNPYAFALGVDVGGSHITAAVVDLHKPGVVEGTEVRNVVDAHSHPEEVLECWYRTIHQAKERKALPVRYMGVAMPGPFDYENGISLIRDMNKYDALFGVNVKEFLAEKFSLPQQDIQFRNDTEAFLDGEVLAGIAKGRDNAIGITLGTGLGTARSMKGFTEDMNLGSSSFKSGIAEDYLSTRWFVKRYRELSGGSVKGVKELVEMDAENEYVHQLFQEFSTNLAAFMDPFILVEKPEIIVIGGSIAKASGRFLPQVIRLLENRLKEVEICTSILGEKAALIGAIRKWTF